MACMEHLCMNCGHMEFNNTHMLVCPKCNSYETKSYWDEEMDYRDDRDDDRDDDREEDE